MSPAQTVPLRYLARLDPGKSEVKHLPDDLEVDFIPMEAVGHGGRLHPTETRPLGEVRDGYTYLRSGDVTFAKISPSFQNRKGGRAQGLTNGLAFATTELTILRPDLTTDARFLQYVIESEPFIQHGAATLHGVAGQQRVDLSRVAAFPVWSPDIDTQRRIADMLDAETARIDTLIEKNERVLGLMDLRDKSTIDQLVNSGEAIDEHGWGAPTEWSRVPIRSLTRTLFVDGDWIESPYITDSGVRLIQTGNIGIGRYKEQGFRYVSDETFDELRCTEVLPGDVLICRLADPVGRACVAPDLGVRMITSVDVTIVRPKPGVLAEYVALILSTERWLQRLSAMSQGGTRDRIARLKLGELRVPLPDLETQRRIVNQWSTISERSSRLRSRVTRQQELLKLRRQALITAAVTGEIEA